MKTFEVYLEKYHEALVGGYTEGRHFYIEAKDAREAFKLVDEYTGTNPIMLIRVEEVAGRIYPKKKGRTP